MSPAPVGSRGRSPAGSGRAVVEWLLEKDQPSIRYRTLTELLGRREGDPDVRRARGEILQRGWAAEILARRKPRAGWEDGPSQYRPKYLATNWMMLVLSDLGLTRSEPVIAQLCEYWMKGFAAQDGGLGGSSTGIPHYCVAANMTRALIRFGYEEDSRVRRTLDRLVATADPKGGWSCWGIGRNLDSWEAMSVFAAYPRKKWTSEMERCVEGGAQFFLERELHRQGDRYPPWFRFHYPIHYYYDLLVGLDFMTALGYGSDPRMAYALKFLRSRRRRGGGWNLDAVHPDLEGAVAVWYAQHPKQRPTPFALENAGHPSKMITLTALKVLQAVDRPPSTPPGPSD
jgi:hypothetical protein